jgi:hypothetical protein
VDTSALGCHDGSAMIAWPPRECSAPTTKSVCPPIPEWTRPPAQVALAWASRSTWSALLTEVIWRHRAMRAGSFTVSVRSIRTSGLRSSQAYRSGPPNANDAVTGRPGSRAPALASPSTPSLNISDHTASPRLRCSPARTASGTAPMPACRVAPSPMSAATRSPMRADASVAGRSGATASGASASIA